MMDIKTRGKTTMGKAKNETVAKYHKDHFETYKLNFRKDDDAELLEYMKNTDIPVSELFRRAFKMYMKKR